MSMENVEQCELAVVRTRYKFSPRLLRQRDDWGMEHSTQKWMRI